MSEYRSLPSETELPLWEASVSSEAREKPNWLRDRETAASRRARDIERLVPVAQELARKAGKAGICVFNLRLAAVQRGILTGGESGRSLSWLSVVMREAGLVASKELRRSPIPKAHQNRNVVWRDPQFGEAA